MDPRPTTARRRHPAARSRVVAGLLSAVLFLGLGAGMAARQTSTATTTEAASSSASTQEDSSSGWAATPGSSSDASPMTSSQGS
jgi:hypothetical protein